MEDASLSRNEAHADTDDNLTDFLESEPSPGAAAPPECPEECPEEAAVRFAVMGWMPILVFGLGLFLFSRRRARQWQARR